jgi:molybdate transport system permease protein
VRRLRGPRGAGGTVVLALLVGVIVAFLAIPMVALVAETPLRRLPTLVREQAVIDAIRVTATTNLIANVIIIVVGTPASYLLATRRFRGRNAVLTMLEVPLVLPPAVAGVGLLAAYGRFGLLGQYLDAYGILIPFSTIAVVLAITFVAAPYYLRQAIAAFEAVDPTVVAAGRTLGAGPARAFATIALPLAASGLIAGWALSFARGVGEFGATLLFAGNVQGVTQTLSLAIYDQFEGDFSIALAISAILLVFSTGVLIAAKLVPTWTASGSTSRSPSVTSL